METKQHKPRYRIRSIPTKSTFGYKNQMEKWGSEIFPGKTFTYVIREGLETNWYQFISKLS